MHKTTLDAVRTMSEMAAASANASTDALTGKSEVPPAPDDPAALWPWGLMQQVQEYMQRQAAAAGDLQGAADAAKAEAEPKAGASKKAK